MSVNASQLENNIIVNTPKEPELRWNYAIKEASQRIEELQDSIKAFERYRDAGEPFLGKIPKGAVVELENVA